MCVCVCVCVCVCAIKLNYKYDQKLFRRYVRNADVRLLTECLFTDDGALLATTRAGTERAVREY